MNLFLIGTIAIVALLASVKHTGKLRSFLQKKAAPAQILPRAITMLVLTAQVSELVRVIEHVSVVNVTAALMLLAIIVATKSGTESET